MQVFCFYFRPLMSLTHVQTSLYWDIGGIAAMTFLLMNCVNLASAQGERFPYNYHPQNFKYVNSGYRQP